LFFAPIAARRQKKLIARRAGQKVAPFFCLPVGGLVLRKSLHAFNFNAFSVYFFDLSAFGGFVFRPLFFAPQAGAVLFLVVV
jgi:hypothetical protein